MKTELIKKIKSNIHLLINVREEYEQEKLDLKGSYAFVMNDFAMWEYVGMEAHSLLNEALHYNSLHKKIPHYTKADIKKITHDLRKHYWECEEAYNANYSNFHLDNNF